MDSRVKKTKNGQVFIQVSFLEMTTKLRGLALCDSCSTNMMKDGYLIPVLNSVYCKKCFENYENRSVYYKEDMPYEKEKTKYFLRALKN